MNKIVITDKIEVTNTTLNIKQELTEEEWYNAIEYCKNVEKKIQWVIGELLIYGEKKKYRKYDELMTSTNYKYQTLADIKYVTENVKVSLRNETLSFTHHREVAPLSPEKQEFFLNKAEKEGLSVMNLRKEIRKEKLQTPTLPSDKFRVVYADPPWKYSNEGLENYGHAETHYPTMTIEELCQIPIYDITEDNAVLFLWATSPMLEEAFKVIKAWGFKYKSSLVWNKLKHNFGYYCSVRHEFLLIATKGSCLPDTKELIPSIIEIERSEKHSEKPERFKEIIEQLYIHGNKIELFARKKHIGWNSFGNEI